MVGIGLVLALVGGGMASASGRSKLVPAPSDRSNVRAPSDRTAVPPRPDGLSTALSRGKIDRAEYALERASSLFDLKGTRGRFGGVERPDPHDATLFLRDLVLHKDELSGADRRRANRILARPTDQGDDPQGDGWGNFGFASNCDPNLDANADLDVCIHYITNPISPDAATNTFAAQAMTEVGNVWAEEIDNLGYKQPQKDGNSQNSDSPDGALDIYLADIGDDGLYGYCTTDEPGAASKQRVSAYCVLDNDYDPAQYNAPPPEVSGTDALQVTLAHEIFHAIQFNYDWREALFLMEGTAVWMEDEVYDSINASYAFLLDSILHQPEVPLDGFQGDDDENFEYGAFVFFTYMSEAHQIMGRSGKDIVRFTWNEAEKPGKKGIAAIAAALKNHSKEAPCNNCGFPGKSTPYRDFFAQWGLFSAVYDLTYSEGFDGTCNGTGSYADILRCERPPFDGQYMLGPSRPSTGWRSLPMDRRSNRFVELFPPGPIPATELRVKINLPNKARGGEASFVMLSTGNVHRIKLNRKGNGSKKVDFAGTEAGSILTLSNTGPHNNETYKFKATAEEINP